MLKERALKATLWSGLDIFLRQGLGFIVSIVLARLIAPAQFGIIALLYLFTGIANVFVDSGFSSALIQKQDTTRTDESTVFWFNLAIGAVAALALGAAAPSIARFFAQPVLVPLTWVLASTVFIGSLGATHTTLLTKALDFRIQMKIGAVSMIISGAVAIALAAMGQGVWALAWQMVAATASTTALLWWMHPWRPMRVFDLRSARRLFGFGGYLLGTTLLDHAYSRLYTILVGKFFGVLELGFYNRAQGTQQMPTGVLGNIFWRVALPVFSAAKDDKAKLQRGVRLAVRVTMLINAPAMLGLAAVARPLIITLFGQRWVSAAPILEVLCLGGVLWPLHVINVNVLMAQGHSRLFFRLQVIKQVIGVALMLAGTLFGVMGIAWSTLIYSVIAFFLNAFYTGRHLGYGSLTQVRDVLPLILISLVMWLVVRGVGIAWQPGPTISLVADVFVGATFIVLAAWALRLRALQEAIDLFRTRGMAPVAADS